VSNSEQPKTTLHNPKSGQEVAKISSRSKTHVDYWKGRLERRTYTHNGQLVQVNELAVRIKFRGIRKSLALSTNNRDTAADKAKRIYLSLNAKGWEQTLKDFGFIQPELENTPDEPTVGTFLAAVEKLGKHNVKTFRRYAQYFRMIVAGAFGIAGGAKKYDYRTGGLSEWRSKVDTILLKNLTPSLAAEWKKKYLLEAPKNPIGRLKTNRSFNAALRNAKSLFSDEVLFTENFPIIVPKFVTADPQDGQREIYWFEKLTFEEEGDLKFRAPEGVTYGGLIEAARKELREHEPDAFLLLLLCLCVGLRRAEADVLLVSQLNPERNSVQIETNDYIHPKQNSAGEVFVDPALMKELLKFKRRASNSFLVESPREWKPTTYTRYRCELHWQKLTKWLAKQGIKSTKKVHELRKLFGDSICKEHGIYCASTQLRHTTVQMTERNYSDPRRRAVMTVGNFLNDKTRDRDRAVQSRRGSGK
jgi:hypothetical protein